MGKTISLKGDAAKAYMDAFTELKKRGQVCPVCAQPTTGQMKVFVGEVSLTVESVDGENTTTLQGGGGTKYFPCGHTVMAQG